MNDFDWRVVVQERPNHFGKNIYIFAKRANGKIAYLSGDVMTEVEIGTDFPPTLVVEDDSLLQAIVNALALKGIKYEKGRLEGELDATKKHLEDMRALVFEEPKIVNIGVERKP